MTMKDVLALRHQARHHWPNSSHHQHQWVRHMHYLITRNHFVLTGGKIDIRKPTVL